MNLPRFWRGNPEGNILEDKRRLERELALQVKACQKLEGQIDRLNKAYRTANESNEKYSHALASLKQEHNIDLMQRDTNHGKEVERLVRNHGRQVQNLESDYSRQVEAIESKYSKHIEVIETNYSQHVVAIKTEHSRDVNAIKLEHSRHVEAIETKHSQQVEVIETKYNKQVGQLEKEINKLVGQLLVNQDSNEGWPDDKLKLKFKELQRLIESLTSPRNKEFLIPPNRQLGSHLDPTNFLGRVGQGKSHFMLKSIIWTILEEQFFAAPFGFGALGPVKGQRELLDVYLNWRKLFDERASTASPIGDGFAIFLQDELANKWRSANFRCINGVLTGGGKRNLAPESPLAKLSTENMQQSVNRIMAVLSEVSKLCDSLIRSNVENEIQKMVNLAGEIALQFGVHTAQLRLSVPHRGAQIQIGEEFHDCEDGDFHRGTIYSVDLVTFPGLERIGDGRFDMNSKQIVAPCEIYPGGQPS